MFFTRLCKWPFILAVVCLLLISLVPTAVCCATPGADDALAWPAMTSSSKPWTYWWWLGNAVDEAGLSSFLRRSSAAGMGGMHIIPIYGVKGLEERYVEYLSPRWLELLHFTVKEARRLGMGVDMSTGTGWPFGGGPQVSALEGCQRLIMEDFPFDVERVRKLEAKRAAYKAIVAVSPAGQKTDLLDRFADDEADTPPLNETWHVYAVGQRPSRGRVERAAPGAEGLVVDPFSTAVLNRYLRRFDEAFARTPGPLPRAQYHDSYEYPGASWTDTLLEEFRRRRGYDLPDEMPAFFGSGDPERAARVKSDYRTTLGELHVEFLRAWVAWSNAHGCLTRNQAHGSPTNLLDAYAAADMPETESFGTPKLPIPGLDVGTRARTAPPHPLVMKFASSAAHTAGRRRVVAETCTWLAEHFNVPLWLARLSVDKLLIAGVNHVVYHGMAYSPPDAEWPGWRFYASTNFAPTNNFWCDFPALNAYVARCQSVLQEGSPSDDVLLYFPIHDVRHDANGMLQHYTVHKVAWMRRGGLEEAAAKLWKLGYGFDYVSDELLSRARVEERRIVLGDGRYRVLVVPACRFLPVKTFESIRELVRLGADVILAGDYPRDVPGLHRFEERRRRLAALVESARGDSELTPPIPAGRGRFLLGDALETLLERAGVQREAMVDQGLEFIRRRHASGYHYFVVNSSAERLDGWVPLAVPIQSAVILDPRSDDAVGLAAVKESQGGTASVYLQLAPGESLVLRTFDDRKVDGPRWRYRFALDAPTLQLGESVRDDSESLPIAVSGVSSQYPGREAEMMTNGAGLHVNGQNTHSKAKSGTAWLAGGPPPEWVVFDLGGTSDVEAVRVWNYNENQDQPLMNRGVKKLTVSVSKDGESFRRAGELDLKAAPGREDLDFSETFPLKQPGVRFVKFDIAANHGDAEYVGIAEVRILGSRRGKESGAAKRIATTWRVTFLRGEPELPAAFETKKLDSWTALGDKRARWVAGTARYEARFTLPRSPADDWILDLGRVADSARVRVNDRDVATLFSLPFSVAVGKYLRAGENVLEVDVTNLDANRISDLDRRGVVWRKFHEINFVNIHYRPFDASRWPPRDSGLIGPVRLHPVAVRDPR